MIPMRTSSIFKSRWMALIWAAGILWVAYDFVGSEPKDDTNNNVATNATGSAVPDEAANSVGRALGN